MGQLNERFDGGRGDVRIEDTLTADPVLQSILIRGEIPTTSATPRATRIYPQGCQGPPAVRPLSRYGQALSFALGDGLRWWRQAG